LRQRCLQVACIVTVLKPERRCGEIGLVKLQGQCIEDAQVRVAGFTGSHACHAIVVDAIPAGAMDVPHRTFRQFIERGGIGLGLGIGAGRRLLFGFFMQLEQRVALQRLSHFHLQLHAIELEQADGLQQGRCQMKLLAQLCGQSGFHAFPRAP